VVGYDIKVKFSVSVGVSGYVRVRVRSGADVGRGQMSYVILGSGGVSAGIKKLSGGRHAATSMSRVCRSAASVPCTALAP